MLVRAWQPSDEAECLRMRCALWPEGDPDSHRSEMLAWAAHRDSVILVAVRPGGERLAGFAEVGIRPYADGCETSPVAYLEGWYVDPDVRRQGIGAALVRAAEAWARERGYREFASDTNLGNVGSQRAHEALGFTEVERAVLYRKDL
jgi:aminoglycoside 6'-N-acetyltransferase I